MSLFSWSSLVTAVTRVRPVSSTAIRVTTPAMTSAWRARTSGPPPPPRPCPPERALAAPRALLAGEVADHVEQPEPQVARPAYAHQPEPHQPVEHGLHV